MRPFLHFRTNSNNVFLVVPGRRVLQTHKRRCIKDRSTNPSFLRLSTLREGGRSASTKYVFSLFCFCRSFESKVLKSKNDFFDFTIFFSCRYMYVWRQLALGSFFSGRIFDLLFGAHFYWDIRSETVSGDCCNRVQRLSAVLTFISSGGEDMVATRAAIRLSRLPHVTVNARKMRLALQDARYFEIGSLFIGQICQLVQKNCPKTGVKVFLCNEKGRNVLGFF